MALVPFPPTWIVSTGGLATGSNQTLNTAGQKNVAIGHLYLPAQAGSKTLSAAGGGKIYFNTSVGNTFANGTTVVSVGLQDVTVATGLPDGTFDVRADLVGGVATIPNNTILSFAMTNDSKTVSHGDLLAIVIEMTARGGADALVILRSQNRLFTYGFPYGITNTTKDVSTFIGPLLIEFDDGTFGWLDGAPLTVNTVARTQLVLNSGSTPDEYVGAFKLAAPGIITGLGQVVFNPLATTFELILYSDPFGTPVAERTWAPDPDGTISDVWLRPTFATPFEAAADTWYGVAFRPTAATNIGFYYYNNGAGNDVLKAAQTFADLAMAARSNQTGAFSVTQDYHIPEIAIALGGASDGAGSGGGEHSHVF